MGEHAVTRVSMAKLEAERARCKEMGLPQEMIRRLRMSDKRYVTEVQRMRTAVGTAVSARYAPQTAPEEEEPIRIAPATPVTRPHVTFEDPASMSEKLRKAFLGE